MTWSRRGMALGGAALLLVLWAAGPVRAAEPAFGTPTISSRFGVGVELTQPVTLDAVPSRVELLMSSGDDESPLVTEVPLPSAGRSTLEYTLDTATGHILPNTPITARWRITMAPDSEPVLGPPISTVYADDRFDWKTVRGDVVRVHWYEGTQAFAERALRIGEEAVAETAALLGVTEDEPVDFFIYADQGAFYDALGPGTRENVGGQANAGIRTLFALIGPSAIDDPWVGVVVPHELVHLVFDTAVQNPYHFPPRWLNEGLAMYLSEGYGASDRNAVEDAGRDGRLIPLDGLTGQFPTTREGFFLAYAESISAVDFFIRTHGQDALVSLISSYAEGRTDDEAFQDAIGQGTVAFNDAWLADLGVDPPVRYGPQPAPAAPLPSAWAGASGEPVASGAPTAEPAAGGATGAGSGSSPAVLVALVLVLAAAGGLVLVRVRSRRARAGDVSLT